ncbi:hypothetical protein CMI42_05300 [Candidatus Pacearchaeota archaeon]|nr:hypothetical protein [Candidatus Pacearchaeota archaeon]|tara:strand:+ start:869 stop:1360 length:492 start_codon:yes stop_codon:yes gene_type:complete
MTPKEPLSGLEELKLDYQELSKKHKLPDFTELNKQFDIEDVQLDTEFLLRKIRRIITEKITNYIRFVELLLNPSSAPMFFFNIIKKLETTDKTALSKIYEKLSSLEVQTISLDLDYNEEKEVLFINKAFELCSKEIKDSLLEIMKKISNGNNITKRNNGSYLG